MRCKKLSGRTWLVPCGGPRERASEDAAQPCVPCAAALPARMAQDSGYTPTMLTVVCPLAGGMVNLRNFTDAAKKFSPKKHRERVGASQSGKQCPRHDLKRNRPCKKATNPLDICPHFKPNRSKCVSGPAHTARRMLMPRDLVLAGVCRSAAAPTPALRHDGTDHLPEQSNIFHGAGIFQGAQTTMDGGLIRPPSAAAEAEASAEPTGTAAGPSAAAAPPPPSAEQCSTTATTFSRLILGYDVRWWVSSLA